METDVQDQQQRKEKRTGRRSKRSKQISSELSDYTTSSNHTMRTETSNLLSVSTNKT